MYIPFEVVPITFIITAGLTAIGVPIARAYARRIDREAGQPRLRSDVDARLERMEQAIDAIAVEVERISEGQRFTTKLLSERSEGGPARVPAEGVRHVG